MSFVGHPKRVELVQFAVELADEARRLLESRDQGAAFECKTAMNPVTQIDREVEREIRGQIERRYPEHGIIGEEYGNVREDSEFTWVLDPIDGTRAFAAGVPVFTSLLALCWNDIPVIGIIDAPMTGDRWIGVAGLPTTRNGDQVTSRSTESLSDAVVAWGYPEVLLAEHTKGAEVLKARTAWRVYGSGSFGVGCIASGSLDLAIESGDVDVTDVCAFVPIIEGAGGVCTDAFGKRITAKNGTSRIAAATPRLHQEALEVLNTT